MRMTFIFGEVVFIGAVLGLLALTFLAVTPLAAIIATAFFVAGVVFGWQHRIRVANKEWDDFWNSLNS